MSTDPVKPGDEVGSGVPVVPVAPVTPVAPVAAGDGEAGDTLPVGDASGGGPIHWSFPPHATSKINAADATMRLERTRAPFERLTLTQRHRAAFVAASVNRCAL